MVNESTTPPDFTEQCDKCGCEYVQVGKVFTVNLDCACDCHKHSTTDFAEQARQWSKKWKAEYDAISIKDRQTLDFESYIVSCIASALAEAATQGQAIGITRAAKICADEALRMEKENKERGRYFWPQEAIGTAEVLETKIENSSPDPDYLDRVRNEAATATIAKYFCDEHQKLLSESKVEKFVCFWCAQNKIAEREVEAATAALEQAAKVIKDRRSWYGEEFFGPMPSMENATESEKRLVTLAGANMARHTCDHLLTEIAPIGDDKE